MKRIPKAIYQTAEEIEMRIAALETDALRLSPDTDAHRALIHIAVHGRDLPIPLQLREYGHGRQVACVNDQVRRSEAFHA